MTTRTEFLASQKVLRLGTVGADGAPHVAPVWYIFRDDRFYIGTNTRTKKARNLKDGGQAAFCIDEGVRSPIRGVGGRGGACLILEKTRVKKIASEILSRYYLTLQDESAVELLEDTDCIIEIIPEQYYEWAY